MFISVEILKIIIFKIDVILKEMIQLKYKVGFIFKLHFREKKQKRL